MRESKGKSLRLPEIAFLDVGGYARARAQHHEKRNREHNANSNIDFERKTGMQEIHQNHTGITPDELLTMYQNGDECLDFIHGIDIGCDMVTEM